MEEGASAQAPVAEKTPGDEYGDVTEEEAGSTEAATAQKRSDDEYGNVTEEEVSGGEGLRIADPIEPWNRAMYHVNDKLYFWLLNPMQGLQVCRARRLQGLSAISTRILRRPFAS